MSYEKISLKGIDEGAWHALRRTGIGGSDAGAVMGVNKYKSPINVYLDKTSDGEVETKTSEAIILGRDMEEYCAQRFYSATGLKPRKSHYMYRSKEYPWMIANIDRMITGDDDAFLECKTTSPYNADAWADGKVPESYVIQCMHYMKVLDKHKCYIACLILGEDFVYRELTWDDELISSIVAKEKEFWENYVLKKVMPPCDGTKAYDEVLGEYYPRAEPGSVVTLKGFDESLSRRAKLQEEIDILEKEKNQIDQTIKLALGDSQYGLTDNYKISWSSVDTTRLDTKKLREEKPDIFSEYSKTTSSRRFQIKVA
ncbi:MAG: YqaJ viral recombinase family protein [Eubacterium sp.]|nr:YqaJ viral recombinase family protein [Eubacterium sp.]